MSIETRMPTWSNTLPEERPAVVAAAAEAMDSLWPGWAERVPEDWDIVDPERCILAAAAGDYHAGWGALLDATEVNYHFVTAERRWTSLWQAQIDRRKER